MGNEIATISEWEPFLSEDRNTTFDKFIDMISRMDSNTSPDLWMKWKNYEHQVVIETPNYFYKIYNTGYTTGLFFSLIREKLAEIYREDFNIKWDVITIQKEHCIYQLEQREKLQVCNESLIDYDDLMLQWSNTLKKLEQKIFLPKIVRQLQGKIKDMANIKLIRDCVNKYEDYGLTKDGNVVLLDDADWFLALIDKDDNWISSQFNCYEIITPQGNKVFVPDDYFEVMNNDTSIMSSVRENANRWIISQDPQYTTQDILDFTDKREEMLFDNIKLLSTGKYLENNKKLFVSELKPYDMHQIETGKDDIKLLD